MNLFKILWVITWALLFLTSEVMETVEGKKHYISVHTLALKLSIWFLPQCQSVWSLYGVWPLTASMEVKNNHAHVTTHRILNKFIGMKFSIGCMVWP